MSDPIRAQYLDVIRREYQKLEALGGRALEQTTEADLFASLDPESNSIAVIVRHLHGNMRSRWTDFLTSDGEKPDRDRDAEFVIPVGTTREDVLRWWREGWRVALDTLDRLGPDDLDRRITIRGEPYPVIGAIERNLAHAAQHVGQIVLLAKHARGAEWRTLSIPRGQSAAFTESMKQRHGA